MKASDLFLRCLLAQGVERVYGVPGEENADIMISLLDSPIEFIICRHEQEAAFMADMYGRLTGRPGVCLATLGPGATNLLTGVANANMDHSPLVAIIGQASTHRLHKESHQNMDAVEMYDSVTKWSTTIRDADVIPEVIQKAFKLAVSGKPGAILVELPEDIAKIDVELAPITQRNLEFEQGVESAHVDYALQLLAEARLPLLLVGDGALRTECDAEIKTLMDRTGIYGATTFMGKGVVSDKHKQSLFTIGLGVKDIVGEAFEQSDLVICVGYGMVEWSPERWNSGTKKRIIHIDVLPAEVDKAYIPKVELVGNIKGILKGLNAKLTDAHVKESNYFESTRKKISTDLHRFDKDEEFPIKPQRIVADIRAALKGDDILISDVGAHKMWVARQYNTYKSKTCFIHNGFCSMGGAMPGAVAAQQVRPDSHVVALCGDGGFMMSIQALVTAIDCKLPIVVVVWQDDFYGLIRWKQEAAFNKSSHVRLNNPDLVRLSEAFGAQGLAVNSVADLSKQLDKALETKDRPSVIVVPVDYRENMKLNKHLGEALSS